MAIKLDTVRVALQEQVLIYIYIYIINERPGQ